VLSAYSICGSYPLPIRTERFPPHPPLRCPWRRLHARQPVSLCSWKEVVAASVPQDGCLCVPLVRASQVVRAPFASRPWGAATQSSPLPLMNCPPPPRIPLSAPWPFPRLGLANLSYVDHRQPRRHQLAVVEVASLSDDCPCAPSLQFAAAPAMTAAIAWSTRPCWRRRSCRCRHWCRYRCRRWCRWWCRRMRGGRVPALSHALVDQGIATFVAISPGVVQPDEFH
jgi:hypothetical protein